MEHWYVSDTHFGHSNIITFCARPWASVPEMDEGLIENWNKVVRHEDHINHLGDISLARGGQQVQERFVKLMRRLHGHKRLFLGNHDHLPIRTYLDAGFEKIYATWRTDAHILFSHIPIHPGSMGSAVANVHGHTHDSADEDPVAFTDKSGRLVVKPYINISVEKTEYRPITLGEVKERIAASISNFTNQFKATSEERVSDGKTPDIQI